MCEIIKLRSSVIEILYKSIAPTLTKKVEEAIKLQTNSFNARKLTSERSYSSAWAKISNLIKSSHLVYKKKQHI